MGTGTSHAGAGRLAPATGTDRLEAVDTLRGVALLIDEALVERFSVDG